MSQLISELMSGFLPLICVAVGFLALWAAYQLGYLVGHNAGWQAGLKRGLGFRRLKELENNGHNWRG